jgi:membrane-associated phospholipid phosphatase
MLTQIMPAGAAGPLDRMAQRIARNREVLGLHYPSDSLAGRFLAAGALVLLNTCPTILRYTNPAAGVRRASDEWVQPPIWP